LSTHSSSLSENADTFEMPMRIMHMCEVRP
jgi:hypothetical protein